MSKIVLGLLATSAGLGLLSLHLAKQMHAGQATITELQAQVAALEKQQQDHRAQATAPGPPPVTGPAESGNGELRVSAPPKEVFTVMPLKSMASSDAAQPQLPSREERMRMLREGRERQRALMQDPEYRDAMRLQNRSNLARSNPGVADALGLDPQQTDELFDLLSDQQLRTSELLQPMWDLEGKDQAGIEAQQRKIQQQSLELQRRNEAEIAAQLGQDKLQAWKEYQSTLGVRHQLEQMRSSLASQGMAIDDDMSKAMVKAMAEAQQAEIDEFRAAAGNAKPTSPRFLSGGEVSPEAIDRQIEATKKRNQRTLDAISPYLTYEQRQAIEKEQEAQLKLQQAHMRIMRSQAGSNANATYLSSGSANQAVLVPSQ